MFLLKEAVQLALTSVFIFKGCQYKTSAAWATAQLKLGLTFRKARSLKPGVTIMLFPSFFHVPSSLWLPAIPGTPWLLVVHLWSLLLSSHGLLPVYLTTRVIGLRAHPNQLCLQRPYFQTRSHSEVLGQTWILGNTIQLHTTSQLNAASRTESYWIVKLSSFTLKKKNTKELSKFNHSKTL